MAKDAELQKHMQKILSSISANLKKSQSELEKTWNAHVMTSNFPTRHAVDQFDRLTKLGYKLNLITGRYEK